MSEPVKRYSCKAEFDLPHPENLGMPLKRKWISKEEAKEMFPDVKQLDINPKCCGRWMKPSFGNRDGYFCENCGDWKPRNG